MQLALVIGLGLLASAFADAPIPQDAAKLEAWSRERLEWNTRSLRGVYDKVGKKDARWDAPAREALDLAARVFSEQVDPVTTLIDVHAPARKAVAAGCDDPMVLYLYARSSVGPGAPDAEEYARRMQAAADAMSGCGYSPFRRAVAAMKAAELRAWKADITPEGRREVERSVDAALDLLPACAAEDARFEDRYNLVNSAIATYRKLGGDYKAAFDRVDARLAKFPGIEALRLAVRGNFQLQWGWEARTTAFAAGVTEEQFRIFEARLREAREALEGAWKANPGEPHVADLMLVVEKGIGGGDREAMETWFARAMTADGNDQDACWSKLDWLDPKWYGGDTPDAMIAFGKACLATKNWRSGITLLAADAHFRLSSRLDATERAKYLRSPEVWSEIQSAYDEYLAHYPANDVARSKYATLCYLAARYPDADAQFRALGDRLTTWPTFPNYTLATLKEFRDFAAKVVANQPITKKGVPASKADTPAKP